MPWMSYNSTIDSKMAKNPKHAYVTLLMTDNYLPGAMVLGHSLKDNGTQKQLVALVTLDTVSAATIDELKTLYDQVIFVERVTNAAPGNLYLMGREDLASTFSKITLWKLDQFSKIVYIDADVVALRAPDELFDLESSVAAVPDVGWPDIFNSGVMALTPSLQDYYALQALARNSVSFDGADQGLLNMHFTRNLWERLSFTYNCTPSGNYQYAPAYRHFGSQISLLHFIGRQKPWQAGRNTGGSGGLHRELTARWWSVYDKHYRSLNDSAISDQGSGQRRTVQQYVIGEANTYDLDLSSKQNNHKQSRQQSGQGENYQQQQQRIPVMVVQPPTEDFPPVTDQRRFPAPQVEWDPTRAPPPERSHPEAANFPTHVYTMSDDTTLFQPPRSYPEPPKDMWYEVPKDKPLVYQRPKAIFPWEANQSRPSRIFPDEPQLPPVPDPNHQPSPMPTLDTSGGADIEASGSTMEAAPETIPTSIASAGGKSEPFASYARTNAWDEVPGIQRYVEALQTRNKKRHSPAGSIGSISQVAKGMHRRPSLILTDFPTEMDRPSLPVTPAPIRRNVFWGGDQSNDEDLPAAEGVPSQSTWDPISRLEELQRRQSEAFLSGPSVSKSLPSREQISSTISSTVQEDTEVSKVSPQSAAVYSPKEASMFLDIDFEHPTTTDVDEIIIPVASLAV